MKIMIDGSPEKIRAQGEKFNYEFWQLRTPLTRYAYAGKPWGLDNGCFSRFERKTWDRMIAEAKGMEDRPKFVCLPDIVGDARRTLDLYKMFLPNVAGLKRCLVLQDGIGGQDIPWCQVDAVFVGGSDNFKTSGECMAAVKVAKYSGRWVHVGRVNTAERVKFWLGIADSIDGSGISKYDHMLRDVIDAVEGRTNQDSLFGGKHENAVFG